MEHEEEYIEDDLQDAYDSFFSIHRPKAFEVSGENQKLISLMDPKMVWTQHTTCDDTFISPGFFEFSPSSCCWKEYIWYVSEIPWKSDDTSDWIRVDHVFSCPKCNPDSNEIGNFDQDCKLCEGEGSYRFTAEDK